MQKWNYEKRKYEPYNVPKDWNCKTYSKDMNEKINCVHCGKIIEFGYSYCSITVHDSFGMAYMVCKECNRQQLLEQQLMKKGDESDVIQNNNQ